MPKINALSISFFQPSFCPLFSYMTNNLFFSILTETSGKQKKHQEGTDTSWWWWWPCIYYLESVWHHHHVIWYTHMTRLSEIFTRKTFDIRIILHSSEPVLTIDSDTILGLQRRFHWIEQTPLRFESNHIRH